MKKLLAAASVFVLLSCGNTNDFDADLDSKVSTPTNQGTTPVNSTSQESPALQPINPGQTTAPAVSSVPVPTQVISNEQTKPGMNPPHGQPGHRCEIPVGAPLNTPAQATTTTTPVQNVTVKPNVNVTPSTQQVQPGMNPPHGQPGHRCEIPVGAPLNSAAPAKTAEVKPADSTKN